MKVTIDQGTLDGGVEKSLTTGKSFYKFMNIPYGEAPVGDLRFRPPRPAGSWTGVRDAKGEPKWCLQTMFSMDRMIGSEDCLNVNVLTPEPPDPSAPLKPVMVHIPGGAFIHGSGSLVVASFDHLVNYDVIMVTFSQRLHILGYLNLNTPSCTGNCGAKDQVLALKWIQKNIRSFGGNPKNVTIFGESDGAVSAHMLAISPMARGLFHKVIIQSGHALSPWGFRKDQVEVGFAIGRRLGFLGSDTEELADFLKKQPAELLHRESSIAMRDFKQANPFCLKTRLFVPSLEMSAEDAFLPDYPVNLIETAHPLPTIMGVAEHEGAIILMDADDHDIVAKLKQDLSEVVRQNIDADESEVPEIGAKLKEFYLSSADEGRRDDHTSRLVDLFSDLSNVYLYNSFDYVVRSSLPLYVYQFAYCGNLNESQFWGMKIPGSLHADESNYIVLSRGCFPKPLMDDSDRTVSSNLCTLWTNFARSGNPNPNPAGSGDAWSQYTLEKPCYLRIDEKLSHEDGHIYQEGSTLWKDLLENVISATLTKSLPSSAENQT